MVRRVYERIKTIRWFYSEHNVESPLLTSKNPGYLFIKSLVTSVVYVLNTRVHTWAWVYLECSYRDILTALNEWLLHHKTVHIQRSFYIWKYDTCNGGEDDDDGNYDDDDDDGNDDDDDDDNGDDDDDDDGDDGDDDDGDDGNDDDVDGEESIREGDDGKKVWWW